MRIKTTISWDENLHKDITFIAQRERRSFSNFLALEMEKIRDEFGAMNPGVLPSESNGTAEGDSAPENNNGPFTVKKLHTKQ